MVNNFKHFLKVFLNSYMTGGKSLNKKIKNSSGFSLIEVVTVAVIISILAAITVPTILGHETKRAKDAVTISAMSDFAHYADQRYHDIGTYGPDPGSGQTLCQYVREEDERFADDNGAWGVGCADDAGDLKCGEVLNKGVARNIKILVARDPDATDPVYEGGSCNASWEDEGGVDYKFVIQAEADSGHCIILTDASPNNFDGGPNDNNAALAVSDNACS